MGETGITTFEVFLNEKGRKGLDNLFKECKEKMQTHIQKNPLVH